MPQPRVGGHKVERLVNRLFDTVGGLNVVPGNVNPNLSEIDSGETSQPVSAHSVERCANHSRFIAAISIRT